MSAHRCRASALRAALVLAAAASVAGATPAVSAGDVVYGSSLQNTPSVTKSSTVDSVYWAQALGGGASAAVGVAGTVHSVTIRGYSKVGGKRTILIQVLRPQPDGSLLVVETSQPFELPAEDGLHIFEPTNMTVQPGDFIGLATIGGEFVIGASAAGAITNDFSGHEKDMNGDFVRPTNVESGVELLMQVDVAPAVTAGGGKPPPPKEEKPPPPKPCKCQQLSVKLDPTLLGKRHLNAHRHVFGVGFTWRMTCTEGNGGCAATLQFRPPVIRAGTLPPTRGLKLNLTALSFECKSACKTSTSGRFEVKLRSRAQLSELFGRTLAFTIYSSCGPPLRHQMNVLIDGQGRERAALRRRHPR